nr:WbqC family protein [Chryseosolibacter indicus]
METSFYEKSPSLEIKDYRSVLNPKKEGDCNRFFKSVQYRQVFGSMFVPNMSIIDLIFCEGPGSLSIVRASAIN